MDSGTPTSPVALEGCLQNLCTNPEALPAPSSLPFEATPLSSPASLSAGMGHMPSRGGSCRDSLES
jgi:hypothetical protein